MKKKRIDSKRKERRSKKNSTAPDLESSSLFLNRELSWLQFNRRIFNEVLDSRQPLLERLKFLAICGSNLDEFFMVRVSGLRRQLLKGVLKAPPDGMTPGEQLTAIRREMLSLLREYRQCWKKHLQPELVANGIFFTAIKKLPAARRKVLRHYFTKQILPTVTPLAMDMGHPFPFISNLCLNLLVVIRGEEKEEKYARIKVPLELFGRFIPVPSDDEGGIPPGRIGDGMHPRQTLVFLEDLLANNLDMLFPGLKIIGAYPFRVTRDAEIEISLDQAADLLGRERQQGAEGVGTLDVLQIGSLPDQMGLQQVCEHDLWLVREPHFGIAAKEDMSVELLGSPPLTRQRRQGVELHCHLGER